MKNIFSKKCRSLVVLTLGLISSACGGGSTSTTPTTPVVTIPSDVYQDTALYAPLGTSNLPTAVEAAAVTQHSINLKDEAIAYTATAGHLTAKAPLSGAPEASIFYVAYTANNKPAGTRPLTFFYNGGPGSDTVWLHLGSFGPKRLATGIPSTSLQGKFEFVDNAESLLNVTDLVFVNAIGTGYSQAIAPNTNASFWGVDADAAVFRDFVQRYIEANARQSSPKYLYGESYGGTRSGVLASLLEAAGVHLEAVILQSPALNYNDDCVANAIPLCGVQLPTLAATALNFQLAPKSVTTLPDYMQQMREFNAQRYAPAVFKLLTQNLAAPPDLLNLLSTYAGLSANDWSTHLDMNPVYYRRTLKPGFVLGRLDSRLFVESTSALAANGADPSFDYIKPAFANTIASYLHDNLKYWNNSRYVVESDAISSWNFRHAGQDGPDVIPDLGAAMSLNPKLRVLNVNGYHDLATPFHWSELELARLNLPGRIFVRNYPGGHMTYLDDATRQQQYQDLLAFYRGTLPAVQLSMAAPPLESSSANLMQKNAQTVQQAVQQTAQLAPGLTVPPGSFVSSKPAGWRPSRTDSPRSANRAPDLQDEITARLRQHFARAAVLGEAGVSRAQLQAAGLTAIAEHFEEIDRTHRGRIYFEEWRNYLQGRQAIPQ